MFQFSHIFIAVLSAPRGFKPIVPSRLSLHRIHSATFLNHQRLLTMRTRPLFRLRPHQAFPKPSRSFRKKVPNSRPGFAPIASASQTNSTTSSRRSPCSIFAITDCGQPHFSATSACVSRRRCRSSRSILRKAAPSRENSDFSEDPVMGHNNNRPWNLSENRIILSCKAAHASFSSTAFKILHARQ